MGAELTVTSLPLNGDEEFRILPSVAESGKFALVSPDVATCDACLAEIRDRSDRRYGYPFHELHQLRSALHDHPRHSLRPYEHHDGEVRDVLGVPRGV